MTRSTKTGALKTLAAAGIAALALAACGNDAASDSESPDQVATEALATEAPEMEEQPEESGGDAAYAEALSGLTYLGEPLEVEVREITEDLGTGTSIFEDVPEGAEFTPAECEGLIADTYDAYNRELVTHSEVMTAAGRVGGVKILAQIVPGAANRVDLGKYDELVETCSTIEVLNGEKEGEIQFEGFPVNVSDADKTHGHVMTIPMEDTTAEAAYLTATFATYGDDLITVAGSIMEVADPDELETILNQIVSQMP